MSANTSLNSTELLWHNSSSPVVTKPKATWNIICYITVFICLIGLIGNGIVFWLLYFRLKINQATVYSLNLAVADIVYLLGCSIIATYFLCLLNGMKTSQRVDNAFTDFGELINNFGFNCSLFLLATLSMERCVAVCCPIWYRCNRPQHLSGIVCGVIWVLSLLITVFERFLFNEYRSKIYLGTSILYVIVSLAMIFSSVVLLLEIQKNSASLRPIKLYIFILAAVISFFISLAPFRVIRMLLFFVITTTRTIKFTLYIVASLCSAINSCANPYIYILIGRWGKSSSIKVALESVFKDSGRSSTEVASISG